MNTTKQQLASLHEHLATLQSVDTETRQQLVVLLADISRLLHANAVSATEHTPAEALETLAAKFDMDHPALSNALRQLVDALGKAGI
jgi:hypothetical protein